MAIRAPNRPEFVGSGRRIESGVLAARKQDLNAHAAGNSIRHYASHIDMNPQLTGIYADPTVQGTLQKLQIGIAGKILTVGDGVNTFGDFNGSYAIQSAIASSDIGGTKSATIFVKAGTYLIDAAHPIDLVIGDCISLIGENGTYIGAPHSVIQDNRSTGAIGAFNTAGELFVSNIFFNRGASAGYIVQIEDPLVPPHFANTRFEYCYFNDCAVKVKNQIGNVVFYNCKIVSLGTMPNYTHCLVSPTITGTKEGIIFDTCRFELSFGNSCASIEATNIAYPIPYVLKYIKFKNCEITNVSIFGSPSTTSQTQSIVNVFSVPGPVLGDFIIEEISIEDCTLFVDVANGFSMQLYLNVPSNLIVENINISGGRWITDHNGVTVTSPIYIGTDSPSEARNIFNVRIKDFETGWGTSNLEFASSAFEYGTFPAELIPGAPPLGWQYVGPAPTFDSQWGAITIAANNIYINNMTIGGTFRNPSVSGEMALVAQQSLEVDGLYVEHFKADGIPTIAKPYGRFMPIVPAQAQSFLQSYSCKNVVFDFGNDSLVDTFMGAIIAPISYSVFNRAEVIFDSCQVLNTTMPVIGTLGAYGFYIQDIVSTFSTFTFVNCVSYYNLFGILYDNRPTAVDVGRMNVIGGDYGRNVGAGIYMSGVNFVSGVSHCKIVDATAQWNGVVSAYPGIQLICDAHTGSDGWLVANNVCRNNNSLAGPNIASIQINCVGNLFANVIGNNCYETAAGFGYIELSSGTASYNVTGCSAGAYWAFGGPPPLSGTPMDFNMALISIV